MGIDIQVKLAVCQHEGLLIAQIGFHRLQMAPDLLQGGIVPMATGCLGRHRLQDQPDPKDVSDLGAGQPIDVDALVAFDDDGPLRFQLPQRLADGHEADAEPVSETLDGNDFAGPDFRRDDLVLQLFVDLRADSGGGNGIDLEHVIIYFISCFCVKPFPGLSPDFVATLDARSALPAPGRSQLAPAPLVPRPRQHGLHQNGAGRTTNSGKTFTLHLTNPNSVK